VDNVTHTLVGAALGEAGLKRRAGLGMATLMIAANLPDVDVLAIPFGEGLTFRRGWTHGPLALVVLPVLLALAVVGLDRLQARRGTRPADRLPVAPGWVLVLAVVGVLSHPFFDWLNTYGIRLLMPFSQEWFYGDAVFIIDPWIWAALGIGVYLSRRRERRAGASPPRPARLALGSVAAYIALMVAGSRAAEGAAVWEIERHQQGPAGRLMAGPVPVNPLRRELIWDVGDAYRFGAVAWTPRPAVTIEAEPLPKRLEHPAVQAAMQRPAVRDFLRWSRFPFFEVDEHRDRFEVNVGDARFSREAGGGWMGTSVDVPRTTAEQAGEGPRRGGG
jgi:inner membrane protein